MVRKRSRVQQQGGAFVIRIRMTLAALMVPGLLSSGSDGWASRPVEVQGEGCVVDGRLFARRTAQAIYPYRLPPGFDLAPLEGKKVRMDGWLAPGDHFQPRDQGLLEAGRCDEETLRLIDGRRTGNREPSLNR